MSDPRITSRHAIERRADVLLLQRTWPWKVKTSLWTLGVFLGVGCASGIGWWIVATLTQARRYWWIAVGYSVAAVLSLVVFGLGYDGGTEPVNVLADIGTALFIGLWLVASVHACFEIRGVLRARVLRLAGGTPRRRLRVIGHRSQASPHDDYLAGKADRAEADLGEFYDAARQPRSEGEPARPTEPRQPQGERPDDDPPGRRLDV